MQGTSTPVTSADSRILRLALLGLLALACRSNPSTLVSSERQHPDVGAALDAPGETVDHVLRSLKQGNERFVTGRAAHPHADARFRQQLEKGQKPAATILGCSDSRVPPELIFDEGFGDLFVVRVAGNIVDVDVAASVEYAVDHLQSPLLVVLGHEGCGAVSAAVQHLRGLLPEDKEPPEVFSLLSHIEVGLAHFPASQDLEDLVHAAVESNVQHSIQELMKIEDLQRAVQNGRLNVVGAVYDLHTGKVRFLDHNK